MKFATINTFVQTYNNTNKKSQLKWIKQKRKMIDSLFIGRIFIRYWFGADLVVRNIVERRMIFGQIVHVSTSSIRKWRFVGLLQIVETNHTVNRQLESV